MNKFVSRSALAAAAFALGVSGAYAATATGTLDITAKVIGTCTVSAPTAVDFGSISGTETQAVNGEGAISVTCSAGQQYSVALDQGKHITNNAPALSDGGSGNAENKIPYKLYSDPDRLIEWTTISKTTGNTGTDSIQVYGKIPASQNFVAGSYTDQVNVTVTYN